MPEVSHVLPSGQPRLRLLRDEESPPYDAAPEPTPRPKRGGFVKASSAVLFNGKLSPWSRLVYFALQSHQGERGIFPRQDVLAGELGTSVDTIQRSLKELLQAGLIRSTRQGRGHANRYELVDDAAPMRYQEHDTADDAAPMRQPETAPVRYRTISKELEEKELRRQSAPEPPKTYDFKPTYLSTLGDFWSQVSAQYRGLDPDLTDVALANMLAEIERDVGPLTEPQLRQGLGLAWRQVGVKVDRAKNGGKPIESIRGFTRHIVTERLKEAAAR